MTEFECNKCELRKTCKKPVPGEFINHGSQQTLFFIGEAPGEKEDMYNRPFVGRSGQLLRKIFLDVFYNDYNIYISNVVKCRPPNNRKPTPEEIETCLPYLLNELKNINPILIIYLGRTAESVSKKIENGSFKTLFLYHPSYALRTGKAEQWIEESNSKIKQKIKF